MAIIELIETLAPWELINTFIIPFIVMFAILWGTLAAMKIFKDKKINAVIALGIVLFLASTDLFLMISQWMIQLGSFVAVGAFLLVFVGGVIMWVIGRGRGIYWEGLTEQQRLRRKEEERAKLYVKLNRARGNPGKTEKLSRQIADITREINSIRARLGIPPEM